MSQTTAVADRLGAGGEAEVLAVSGRPDVAFKRYRKPSPHRTAKLRVMVAHPPDDRPDIAWPIELVTGTNGDADGFLMRRVDLRRNVPLFQIYNPGSRLKITRGITWRHLIRTARNTAAIVDALHRAGYVVGDLNESNLLVDRRAVVTLLDCDSMQVRDPNSGRIFPCAVGKPEFTPPELHRADLAVTERTQEGDAFALSVLVFLLLMEGTHPFASVWRGAGDPPDVAARIRMRAFPYRWWRRLWHRVAPPPLAVPIGALPWRVQRLFRRSFTVGLRRPARRPTAREWIETLDRLEAGLHPCRRSEHHLKPRRLGRCPWCRRVDGGVADPFPGPGGEGVAPRPRRLRQLHLPPALQAATDRIPAPPEVVVRVAAAVAAGAVLPIAVVVAVAVGAVATQLRDVVGAARTVGTRIAVAVGGAPLLAAASATRWSTPSLFVLSGRFAGAVAAGLLAYCLPPLPATGARVRWWLAAAAAVGLLLALHSHAWWWPLRL